MSQAGIISTGSSSGSVDSITATAPLTANGSSGTPQTGAVTIALMTPLAVDFGGTGADTLTGLVLGNGTSPMTAITAGDNGVLISSSSGVPSWLANGTAGYVLTANSGAPPSWQASGGGGGGITTINGDSGSVTGSTITIYADQTDNNCGSTVSFVNSGTTSTLNLNDANLNMFLGTSAGGSATPGFRNIGLGLNCFANTSSNTSQQYNIGIGTSTLDTLGSGGEYNVAIGLSAFSGTPLTGSANIALGMDSFGSSTVSGTNNIGLGGSSFNNTTVSGGYNIGLGYQAFAGSTVTSDYNIGIGYQALASNGNTISGASNIAIGYGSLSFISNGAYNYASGYNCLPNISSGSYNIGIGYGCNPQDDSYNICLGYQAGSSASGGSNIYIQNAGSGESNTIRIGTQGTGNAEQDICYIAGIYGSSTSDAGSTTPVLIDNTGNLGTISSSARYKENIKDIGDASSGIYSMRPVSFNYTQDKYKHEQFGLIAEEVEKIYPGIVIKNKDGKPDSIQYQYLPFLLLNEIQKLNKRISDLESK